MIKISKKCFTNYLASFWGILSLLALCFILNIGEANADSLPNQSDYTGVSSGSHYSVFSQNFGSGWSGNLTSFSYRAVAVSTDVILSPALTIGTDFYRLFTDASCTHWAGLYQHTFTSTASEDIVDLSSLYIQKNSSGCYSGSVGIDINSGDNVTLGIGRNDGGPYFEIFGSTSDVISGYCDYNGGGAGSCGGTISDVFFKTVFTPPPPATQDYVQYNYSTGHPTIVGAYPDLDPVNWSVHYNVCDTGYPPNGGNLRFRITDSADNDLTVNGDVRPFGTTGFSGSEPCQGDFIYDGQVDTGTYGTSTVFIVMTTENATGTPIQQINSSGFTVTQLPHVIYSNGNIYYGGANPLYINTTQGSGTTHIPFDYNVCAQSGWASSTFVLENLDNNNLTSTATSSSICSGTGYVSIPYGTSTVANVNGRIDLVNGSGDRQILGNSFAVSWQNTNNPSNVACNPPSYDVATICDGITSDSLGIKCGVKFALVASGQFLFYPSCSSLNNLKNGFYDFKRAFPFNTYFQFTDSINTAIDSALVSTSTQGISVPFIRKTATSSEYYMLPVMTSSSMSNTIGVTNYNTFQTTIGYFWWLVIAFIIFLILFK